ncbi:hypothetical protein [Sphaerisporangium dianthi]|uniref:DUF2637 domain-containing protein n=1 Tax=Sphaerisporangium dianthi TaxID=1436120 RepID=A0ABV9CSD3_9ACTN
MTRRWPLLLLALPAGVATWSGWVGLGELTGFGPVKPLPGIADLTINTAVTLPIGVEAYAAYALHAWLSDGEVSPATRAFAKWSALGSLLLGMLGQVGYHLLATSGQSSAPWQVTTVVSCLPVLVLGMGAALGHMLARDGRGVPDAEAAVPEPVPVVPDDVPDVPERVPLLAGLPVLGPVEGFPRPVLAAGDAPRRTVVSERVPGPRDVPEDVPEMYLKAVEHFADDLDQGRIPPYRRIKDELHIGQDKAQEVRAYLAARTRT